ncbi:general secretory pathway protein [Gloeothece citriformis PCC 7424]|uniref:General secretory pathway protein n=1 Tax=Gloeothece citriformis (strain PCC 7424) TaxID=65393 RepID=B7KID0_GLOC7|nr:prepilin-type N-terminal cleavage/methylation domain-containing protein [Gloeothece citriformis]ACK73617.1 general secretory pathway protein [Gloeothece citriformis PCC 7424]
MNTRIVTLLIYRYKFLKNLQSPSTVQGFTLLEILITTVIIGILAVVAIPSYVATIDKFKYGDAKVQMNCMAKELRTFKLENGYYPRDVNRNIVPKDRDGRNALTCFPRQPHATNTAMMTNDQIPFKSVYDYEARATTHNGQSACAIYIVFLGKNQTKQTPSNFTTAYQEKFGFYENQDDLIMSVDIGNSPCL